MMPGFIDAIRPEELKVVTVQYSPKGSITNPGEFKTPY